MSKKTKKLAIVKDNNLRSKILQFLYSHAPWLQPQLAVYPDGKVCITNQDKSSFDITRPGMLYETKAMASAGWLARDSAYIPNEGIFAYFITEAGIKAFQNLNKVNKEKYLSERSTNELLGMLQDTRSGADEGRYYSADIKAELAKRPHVMNKADRRKKFSKKEKGDARRVRQKRYKVEGKPHPDEKLA